MRRRAAGIARSRPGAVRLALARVRRARLPGEVARAALSARASSALVGTIVAGSVLAIVLTTGQSAAAERQVLDRIDEAGSRALTIEQGPGAPPLPGRAVAAISRLSGVEWAVGTSTAVDGRNAVVGPGGDQVPFRYVVGDLPAEVRLPARPPGPGEALVPVAAAERLGLGAGAGAVDLTDGVQLAVVGTFHAGGAAGFLTEAGIVPTPVHEPDLHRIHVLATDTAAVPAVAAAARSIIAPADAGDVRVGTAPALGELDRLLRGDLGAFGRGLLAAVLAIGALLIAAATAAQTVLRRRDLGRRRALGATRSLVVALLVGQTALAAVAGSTLGLAAGFAAAGVAGLDVPPASFLAGAGVLATLTATLATIPPAVAASRRDPIAVLRTP